MDTVLRLAALCLLGALLAVLLRRGGGELALLLVLAVCGVAVALLLEPLGKELHSLKVVIAADSFREAGKAHKIHILIAGQIGRFLVLWVMAHQERPAPDAKPLRDYVLPRHVLVKVLSGDEHRIAILALDTNITRVVAVAIGHA